MVIPVNHEHRPVNCSCRLQFATSTGDRNVVRRYIVMLALAAALPLAGASMSVGETVIKIQSNPSCVSQCRAAHNQCRIAGRSNCDAQLQSCLQGCLGGR